MTIRLLSCHSEHEQGIFFDLKANGGLKMNHHCTFLTSQDLKRKVRRSFYSTVFTEDSWHVPNVSAPRKAPSPTVACATGSIKSKKWANCSKSTARTGTARWGRSRRCSPKAARARRRRF